MKASSKKVIYIALTIGIVCAAFLFAGIIIAGDNLTSPKPSGEEWNGNQRISINGDNAHIGVPCFNTMYFKANTRSQQVNLYNPEDNDFIVSMELKLESGETLWSAENIYPNHGFYEIEISRTISSGEYKNCELLRKFYKMDGTPTSSPLSTKFTLYVI